MSMEHTLELLDQDMPSLGRDGVFVKNESVAAIRGGNDASGCTCWLRQGQDKPTVVICQMLKTRSVLVIILLQTELTGCK